jgi:hypothetical protein
MTEKDDPKTARRLVEEDMRNVKRAAIKAGFPVDYISYEHGLEPTEVPEGTLINHTIGTRDALTKRDADAAAQAFRELRRRHPQALIALSILGYDQDPRELWEFPEVCRYVRRFARSAGLSDWRVALEVPWVDASWGIGFLAGCGVFGDDAPIRVNLPPPTIRQ